MLDRVTGMQVFARVAALGSLSAAARALGMSQTMATKHMASIEERLGVKLLHRTTRRLTLTEPGRRYLEAAERILAKSKKQRRRLPPSVLKLGEPCGSTSPCRLAYEKSLRCCRNSPGHIRP
jgi:DNA-binding transcriptional LysR family regulator